MRARSLIARSLLAGAVALGMTTASLTGAQAAPANTYIATPNGMVGVQQTIIIRVPSLANQVATIGFVSGATSNAGQTQLNAQGIGSLNWTPTTAGSWTISGLGNSVAAGSTTINVAPMPTNTILLTPNLVQSGSNVTVTAVVSVPLGVVPPAGTVALQNANGNVVASGTLQAYSNTTSTVNLTWAVPGTGTTSLTGVYTPSFSGFLPSTSPASTPQFTNSVPTVALRFPPVLYVGTPTVLGAELGTGVPGGSAAFSFDGQGVTGSVPTNNLGIASTIWTPPSAGVHTISVNFSSSNGIASGVSNQQVNIQPAKAQDVVTVAPAGGAAWSPGAPIVVTSGSSTVLNASSTSGATVVLSETGPCVINGSTLIALAPGVCTVTAVSPGSATVTPDTNNYTVTVQAAAKKKRR